MAYTNMDANINGKKVAQSILKLLDENKENIEKANKIDIKNNNGFKINFDMFQKLNNEINAIEEVYRKIISMKKNENNYLEGKQIDNLGTICLAYDGNTYCLLDLALKAILAHNSIIITSESDYMKATNELILILIQRMLEAYNIDKNLVQILYTSRIEELLSNSTSINRVFAIGNKNFQDKNIISALQKKNIPIKFVEKFELDKLANGNHQGIMISIPDYEYVSLDELLEKENPLLVILDHLEDPHNFGAIIRTCEAAGVDGIIIPKDRSVSVNSTVMKTSAGALNNMKICMVTNLNSTIKELKKNGIWIIGTDMVNSVSYTKIDYDIPLALVIGSEGFGISRLVRESCDYIVNIPMVGKVNSLNASVAAGVLIYKIFEKRNF